MQVQAVSVQVAVTADLPPATNAVMVRTPAGELLVVRDAS